MGFIALAAATILASGAHATQEPEPAHSNVVYGQGETRDGRVDLRLDLYEPDEACTSPRPFVIAIHGGGYHSGSKDREEWHQAGGDLALRGISTLVVDYRLLGEAPTPSPPYEPLVALLSEPWKALAGRENPAMVNTIASSVQDTMSALTWARVHATEQCLDPDRYVLWGASAGAFTAILVGYGLDEIDITVPLPSAVIDYYGGEFLSDSIQVGDAPLFIVHGSADGTVPYRYAIELEYNANAVSVPLAFYTLEGADHGWRGVDVFATEAHGVSIYDLTLNFIEAELMGGGPLYEVVTVNAATGAGN